MCYKQMLLICILSRSECNDWNIHSRMRTTFKCECHQSKWLLMVLLIVSNYEVRVATDTDNMRTTVFFFWVLVRFYRWILNKLKREKEKWRCSIPTLLICKLSRGECNELIGALFSHADNTSDGRKIENFVAYSFGVCCELLKVMF